MTVRTTPKYTEALVTDADRYITDPSWVMEQKMDGTRGLAVIGQQGVWFPGRGGRGALAHTAATQHLPKINPVLRRLLGDTPGEIVVDGEIMLATGEYRLFDLPYVRIGGLEHVVPDDTFERRRAYLEGPIAQGLAEAQDGLGPVSVVRQARSAREKSAMWEAINAAGVEGAIVKHLDGRYQPDVRVKDVLKLKLVKTADVVVTGSTRSRNEAGRETGGFAFAVHDESGALVSLGSCSAIGKPHVEVGDVIEVAYLFRQDGGSLVQPRMIRVRTDKAPVECDMTQFPAYSRDAI
jgi:ATP-dependent DNA ligase